MKRNVPILGFIIGALLPTVGLLIIYAVLFREYDFGSFMKEFFSNGELAAKVISLSALINIAPFIFYTNRRLDLTARGIFIATMLYMVLFILLKYVW